MNSFKLIYISYFLVLCGHSKGTVSVEESDFLTVSRTSAFVDKTLLIKTVFQTGRRMLITAPRKFGKSMNLDMLKTYLSLESKNIKEILLTFKNMKIYENNSTFFRDNFAKHPVLYVDFKSGLGRNYDEAIYAYKRAIHNAYLEHKYLINSQNLWDGDKKASTKWCDENSFENMGMSGLAGLVRMLKEHFDKTVVVLIDEYDSIINNALFTVKSNSEFQAIVDLTSHILTTLLKGNENVQIAVVTGVSYISTTGLSEIDNLEKYRFLHDHPFVSFYGLTEDDVRELFDRDEFKLYSNKYDLVTKLYNGYVCKRGRRIYNTYSFLKFLSTGKAVEHLAQTGYVSGIFNILKYSEIQINILSLLNNEIVNVTVYNTISINNVFHLKDLYSQSKKISSPNVDLLLSHLLEIGFLTYQTVNDRESVVDTEVKIPNKDVYSIMFTEFKDVYIEKCKLPRSIRSAGFYEFLQTLISAKGNCGGWFGKILYTAVEETVKTIIGKHL